MARKNVPVDKKLWSQIQSLAKGERKSPVTKGGETANPVNDGEGFKVFPSAYANGWALAQYKRLGGKWKKEGSEHKKPRKWDKEHCESKTCDEMGFSEKASCRPYKNCYQKKAHSLVSPPPSVSELVAQLPEVSRQYEERYNKEELQPYLDKCFWEIFDRVLTRNGHGSRGKRIKEMGDRLAPLISSLKNHFNLLRPNQLAGLRGIPFNYDYLESAQTASYPSGHTTQAYYIAYKLSDEFPKLKPQFLSVAKMVAESRVDRGVHFPSDNEAGIELAKNLYARDKQAISRLAVKRDDPKKKNTGHGGLDTWFSGHGGGKPKERATWGDWVAITPVKHTIKKDDGKKKTYEHGDIVGPCGISSEPEWASLTGKGKKPLKCMPREKAHNMPKKDRASLAKNKKKQESKSKGKKPVNTPTFSEEAKEIKKSAARVASRFLRSDFYRQVSPPDELSNLSQGMPVHRTNDPNLQSSSLPNGDSARNIGRPSPDSPSLKHRDLHDQPKPSGGSDVGYVHDSGSGSARVIPYDSGFTNNSSPLRRSAGSQPAQDLAGVKTWVTKNRQDQSYKSTEPLKTRPDYGDGSPDRDRVLPLPDGHPKGRDEIRQGPGVMNTPPDSSGQGSANRPPKNPNAISEKPLHQRPRSSGIP